MTIEEATLQAEQLHHIDALSRYLDEKKVGYLVVEHPKRFTAASEARAAGVELDEMAKAVLLRDGGGYVLTVIPASRQLDLRKVREELGRDRDPRLASEDDLAGEFPWFELGAVPPLGPRQLGAELMDRRLVGRKRVLCSGGDHSHSVVLDPDDILRVTGARVADICED
jgi:Ala-tRNA(Pro) deacylase